MDEGPANAKNKKDDEWKASKDRRMESNLTFVRKFNLPAGEQKYLFVSHIHPKDCQGNTNPFDVTMKAHSCSENCRRNTKIIISSERPS